jgi:hypothetical protein
MRRSRMKRGGKFCPLVRLKHGTDPDSKFDPKQLRMGAKVEMEHVSCPNIAKAISKAHLAEIPDYYTRLARMEKGRC